MLITSLSGLEERENRASNMEALVYMGKSEGEIPAIMRHIQRSIFLKLHLGESGTSWQRRHFIKIRFNRVNNTQTNGKPLQTKTTLEVEHRSPSEFILKEAFRSSEIVINALICKQVSADKIMTNRWQAWVIILRIQEGRKLKLWHHFPQASATTARRMPGVLRHRCPLSSW